MVIWETDYTAKTFYDPIRVYGIPEPSPTVVYLGRDIEKRIWGCEEKDTEIQQLRVQLPDGIY